MAELLESDRIKLEILKVLSNGKVYSFYLLSKLLKTNYNTIKKNCFFLELLGLVEIVKVEREESATGIPSYRIRITKKGLDVMNRIRRKLNLP
ncbi:hypothetical protein [Archaeoglobus profundus]|uniref:ArnR1-like winged helix-turn-helix domain-containing protein n=1 Tax=Archaeoglobus profundus (strain DSM 5631 / JCM 9629 / NBRC 100127 / Av18) TaxID=572546 RepID=D2RI93_ARCPA|nr:hypothetical protein [Archaeoglobus profundus]ADB58018.1 hypothetical protein Arcpr_0957 [Archaeoglobus profundus DSM 5631]